MAVGVSVPAKLDALRSYFEHELRIAAAFGLVPSRHEGCQLPAAAPAIGVHRGDGSHDDDRGAPRHDAGGSVDASRCKKPRHMSTGSGGYLR